MISEFFKNLNDQYGVNFSILYSPFDMHTFLLGMRVTILLSIACIVLSVLLGILGTWLRESRSPILRGVANVYVLIFRNTPPLIQLYFFFFAIGPVLGDLLGSKTPLLGSIQWATISLSLYAGAFNVEIFRSGLEAVSKSTSEAAYALGLNRRQLFFRILIPLSIRISLPALTNNLVNLIKTTTQAFAIAVPGVLYASQQIWSDQFNVAEMMIVLMVFFIGLIALFVYFTKMLERRLRIPGWGVAAR